MLCGKQVHVNMGGEIANTTPTGIVKTLMCSVCSHCENLSWNSIPRISRRKTESFSGVVAFLKKSIADVEKDAIESQTEVKKLARTVRGVHGSSRGLSRWAERRGSALSCHSGCSAALLTRLGSLGGALRNVAILPTDV